MAVMTGSRFFAEAMRAYGVSHIFFVPTMLLPAMAEMEDMNIRRVVTHGEKPRPIWPTATPGRRANRASAWRRTLARPTSPQDCATPIWLLRR